MPDPDEQHADGLIPHLKALQALRNHAAALPSDGTAVEQLIHIKELEALLNRVLDLTVAAARADGRSWKSISEALRMRRQSAQERWGNKSGTGDANSDERNVEGDNTPSDDAPPPMSRRRPPALPVVEDVEARLTALSLFKRKAHFQVTRAPARSS